MTIRSPHSPKPSFPASFPPVFAVIGYAIANVYLILISALQSTEIALIIMYHAVNALRNVCEKFEF